MRATLIVITILLAAPFAAALKAPALRAPGSSDALADISDADLLFLMAQHKGLHPQRLAIPVAPAGLTLATMVQQMSARVGQPLTPTDVAAFDAIDPRVAAPTLTMLLAMDKAWDLRDRAFAAHSTAELRSYQAALRAGQEPPAILTPDEEEMLINGAILVSDTLESVVIPQLQALANSSAWLPTATADPVGILRIGGTGNDIEHLDRMLQIDPRGDDWYWNNAGGTTVLNDLSPTTPDFPVAVSLDLAGDDHYRMNTTRPAQGGGELGIGLLEDLGGSDSYRCLEACEGAGADGVGLLRDYRGSDNYTGGNQGTGYGDDGMGVLRDDAGADRYAPSDLAGGFGEGNGIGLIWDEGGQDAYVAIDGGQFLWGDTFGTGHAEGWFVGDGPELDSYTDPSNGNPPHQVCNDCTWLTGANFGGHGNDDHGSLAYLIAEQR